MLQIPDRKLIDRAICELSLHEFTRRAWNQLEPGSFQDNWHIGAICEHLQAVADRQIKQIIINIPPRHMKSLAVNVFFPAWVWAQTTPNDENGNPLPIVPDTWRGPGVRFLSIAWGSDLAGRDAKKTKTLIQSPWYQERWGHRFRFHPSEGAATRYSNMSGGARYTGSFSAGILGEGGDIVMTDDPHPKANMTANTLTDATETWSETIKGRGNDPKTAAFVLIMQRLHENDLTGYILAKEMGWDHLCLPEVYEPDHPFPIQSSIGFTDPRLQPDAHPLLWPDRFGWDEHKQRETDFGPFASAGQLQQRPTSREGGLFKRHWWLYADDVPKDGQVLRRWDMAGTEQRMSNDPDWTVGVKVRKTSDGLFWVEDVVRFREEPFEAERIMRATAEMDGHACQQWIPQDPGAGGKYTYAHHARMLAPYPVRLAPEGELGDKFNRADPFAGQVQAGNVILRRASWNSDFIEEHALFPNASHDDQVDASSGAFHALHKGGGGVFTMKG